MALPDTALLASAITLDPEASNTTCLTFSTDEADWVLDDGSGKTHGESRVTDWSEQQHSISSLCVECQRAQPCLADQ
jgi:predicted transglutaminase-like cysteine proteinase